MAGSGKASRFFFCLAFLLPAVVLYAVFVIGPLLQTFQLSQYRFSGLTTNFRPVGWENYQHLAQDESVWIAFRNVFLMLSVGGVAILALSLLLAHAVEGFSRQSKVIRSVYLFPQVLSVVAVAVLWRFVFHPTAGLMAGLGLKGPQEGWLGSTDTAFWVVLFVFVWLSLGFYTMLFSAGLGSIPKEIKEASALEGVKGWQNFWLVSWPLLHPIRRVALVYLVVNVMATFALVNVMTDGAPADQTQVVLNYLYRLMMESKFGQASALGAINFLVILAVTLIVLAFLRRNPEESRAK